MGHYVYYHILVWIEGASVIGKDRDGDILHFIQRHVKCGIPEQVTNPELYRLVTKYTKCTNAVNTATEREKLEVFILLVVSLVFLDQKQKRLD